MNLELVENGVDVVFRLDSTCCLLYHPTVSRGILQVVTALFSAFVTLHVRAYDNSFIIKASGFIQAKLRSKQLVSSTLPVILSLRNPLYYVTG